MGPPASADDYYNTFGIKNIRKPRKKNFSPIFFYPAGLLMENIRNEACSKNDDAILLHGLSIFFAALPILKNEIYFHLKKHEFYMFILT